MAIREFLERWDNQSAVVPFVEPLHPCITGEADVIDLNLDEFERSDLVLTIRSRLFGEDVMFVPTEATKAKLADSSLAAYSANELSFVARLSEAALRRVHRLKKRVEGEIIDITKAVSAKGQCNGQNLFSKGGSQPQER